MQPGERQFHLRLHAGDARHLAPLCVAGQVFKQRRLADAGLTVQHEHPALARPDGARQAVKDVALGLPTGQVARSRP
jgi:hypothetical protein